MSRALEENLVFAGISTPSAIDNGILSTTAPWTTLSSDIVQESTSKKTVFYEIVDSQIQR